MYYKNGNGLCYIEGRDFTHQTTQVLCAVPQCAFVVYLRDRFPRK